MKRLLTLLLSAIMLLTPVLAGAESADGYYYFSLSNPVVEMAQGDMTNTVDLSGLELKLAAEGSEGAADIMIGLLANGKSAIAGYLGVDETGISAIVDGMQSSVSVPAAVLEALMQQAAAELESAANEMNISVIGGADGPTNIVVNGENLDLDEFFSAEAMAEFEAAMESFAAQIEVSEPEADVVMENDAEVPAQRVDYAIGTEALAGILKAAADLAMTNEQFAEGYKTALEEEGAEYVDPGLMIESAVTESAICVEGSVFMTEAGNIYTDNYLLIAESADENGDPVYSAVNLEFSVTSDDMGQYIYGCLYPNDTEEIELYVSMMDSEIEGEQTFYADLCVYSLYEEQFELNTSFALTYTPYIDESGLHNTICDLTVYSEDEEVSIGLNFYGDQAAHGGFLYLSAGGERFILGYDGVCAESTTYTGQLYGQYETDGVVLGTLSCDIAFGVDTTGESIAYDFSTVPTVDLSTMDEETAQALEEDMLSVVYSGLTVIGQEIPLIGMLLTATGITGTNAG